MTTWTTAIVRPHSATPCCSAAGRPAVGPGTDTSASCSGWPGAPAHRARRGAVVLGRRSVPAGRGVPAAASAASVEMLHQQRPFPGRCRADWHHLLPGAEGGARPGALLCRQPPCAGGRPRCTTPAPDARRWWTCSCCTTTTPATPTAASWSLTRARTWRRRCTRTARCASNARGARPPPRGCVGARRALQRSAPLTSGCPRQVVSGRPINVDVAEERPSHSRGAGPGAPGRLGLPGTRSQRCKRELTACVYRDARKRRQRASPDWLLAL